MFIFEFYMVKYQFCLVVSLSFNISTNALYINWRFHNYSSRASHGTIGRDIRIILVSFINLIRRLLCYNLQICLTPLGNYLQLQIKLTFFIS